MTNEIKPQKKSKLKNVLVTIDKVIKAVVGAIVTFVVAIGVVALIALAINTIPAAVIWAILVFGLKYKVTFNFVYWWTFLLVIVFNLFTQSRNGNKKDK